MKALLIMTRPSYFRAFDLIDRYLEQKFEESRRLNQRIESVVVDFNEFREQKLRAGETTGEPDEENLQ
jgi:hypothetical protein